MLPNELIERIATAYEGKVSAAQMQALEKELNVLPGGNAEAAAYRQLWGGFNALQAQEFREKMKPWEEEAALADDEELAEWYLSNSLHPDNQQYLSGRVAEETEFARTVEGQQKLQVGFDALKSQNFRQQVSNWEEEAQNKGQVRRLRPGWLRPLSVAAGFLLLIALGGNWYGQKNYSNAALAETYYKETSAGGVLGAGTERDAFMQRFAEAHKELRKRKPAEAAEAAKIFQELATQAPPADLSEDDLLYYQDNIEWNLLVARLMAGNTTNNFDQLLNRIAQDSSHTYYEEALELQKDLASFWR